MADAVRYGSVPFAEAIQYLRTKVPIATAHWDDILGNAHDRSFVIAGATKADLLADIHADLVKAAAQGMTVTDFTQRFEANVAKHGWVDWTGSDSPEGRAWRAQTIYETNLRTAYQAGRRAQHMDEMGTRPYLKYNHSDGAIRPRPLHVSWHGTILRADDPWWNSHYTPNGWRCRCYITSLAQRDMDDMGRGPDTAPNDGSWAKVDRHGVAHEVPKGIDYGWNHAPGSTRDLVAEVKAKAAGLPPKIGADLRADVARVPLARGAATNAAVGALVPSAGAVARPAVGAGASTVAAVGTAVPAAGAGDVILAGNRAYEVAQTLGRPHHGWLQQQRTLPTVKLHKAIRSLRKQIAQHEAWIADPFLKYPADHHDLAEVRYHQEHKWPHDIARQREQIAILEGVIRERNGQ